MRARFHVVVGVALALGAGWGCAWGQLTATPTPQADGRWRDASVEEYRAHLTELRGVVEECGKGRDVKSCDPMRVGLDDRVQVGGGRRLVRYGWLRVLLSRASDTEIPAPKAAGGGEAKTSEDETLPATPSVAELLRDAETRLNFDLGQAGSEETGAAGHEGERAAMRAVLAEREFRNLEEPTARDAALEKLSNWLNLLFESVARVRARSKWVGRLIVWGFMGAVCVGLVWGLLQLERRWRIKLTPEETRPGSGAVSARDWQLWLTDARAAAAAGDWREAIHFAYWASIARLEAKRVWPADRARTPREYLALVGRDDPRREGLAALTRSFERTWYGGQTAEEGEYRQAEELAARLMGTGGASGGGEA